MKWKKVRHASRATRKEILEWVLLDTHDVIHEYRNDRPRTRGDCENGHRPCPWVSCRYHMWVETNERGLLTHIDPLPFEIDVLPGETHREWTSRIETEYPSCSLDHVDGIKSLQDVGKFFGLSKQRVDQILISAVKKLKVSGFSVMNKHVIDWNDRPLLSPLGEAELIAPGDISLTHWTRYVCRCPQYSWRGRSK